jgi:large subunit ribosomal protein L29
MKIEKFREMTQTDLQHKLEELHDTLFKTKVKIQTKQVENTAQLASLRKDIARIHTLLGEYARGVAQAPAPMVKAPEPAAEKPAAKEKVKEKPAAKEKAAAKAEKAKK